MKGYGHIIGAVLLMITGLVYGGVFQQGEHGGVDASYPDRGDGWYFDGVTGVSRAHIDSFYSAIPRGQCYHCHEYLNVLQPLYWPMTFTAYDTQEQRVDFCGNCHTDTDPDANGTDGDTPADYSFKGPSKFKLSQHYKRKLRWPGGQYGSDYPERTDEKAGVCTNCHNPHAHAYSSSYASIPEGWEASDVPFPKQLAELTDVNNTPDPMPDWGVTMVNGVRTVTGWPNVNGRDPDDAEDICFTCHDGDPVQNLDVAGYNTYAKWGGTGASSSNSIKAAIEQPYRHPVKDSEQVALQTNPGTHFAGSTAAVLYKVECTTCHNPHLASGHWNDFYDDPTATPLVLPGVSPDWPNPAPVGYEPGELWGDEPSEKMNGLMQRMFDQKGVGGCGTWQFNVDRGLMGQVPPCDQPAIYRAPIGGDGTGAVTIQKSEAECIADGQTHPCYKSVSTNGNFQPDGDQLPDIPTFCLDCHQNQVADHRPIYWGAGFPTAASIVGQPQGHEPHGFDSANAPAFGCYDCDGSTPGIQPNTSPGCWALRGSGPLVGETRGLGYQTFTRAPYDIEDRLSGANFVLACTDCHEPHGSPKRSLFRHTVNGYPIGSMTHNEICSSCHYYNGGEMKYDNCGGGGLKSCGSAGCHNGGVCAPENPGNYCYSLHRIQKNNIGNSYFVYKPKSPDHPYQCTDNGPGVIGVWHFDDNNATSGVTRGSYEDSSANMNDLVRGHKGTGIYDGPFDGTNTGQPWSGSLCTNSSCASLFSTAGPFGYTGDKSMNFNGRDAFAFSRVARCHNMRTPNPEIMEEDGADPASDASNFTIEAWVYFDPTMNKGAYSVTGHTSFGYHPGGRLLLTSWACAGTDSCIPDQYYPTYTMSVYDKTWEGVNGSEVTTDTSSVNDARGVRTWKEMPIKQWTLLTVTFDSSRTENPIRIHMNGVDVTSTETRDADAAPNATKSYDWSQPPTGWGQNSDTHPFLLPNGSADAKYCPTCNAWFKNYMSYMQGWSFGIQSSVGSSDGTFCGGNMDPDCGWPDSLEGMMDDVRIANVTLTDEEVCARYVNGMSGAPAPTNIEPGIAVSNCSGWLNTEPAVTPEPIIDATSWLDEKILLTDPNILQSCITHPDDGSATARGVVAMWQFDNTSNPFLDSSGNGGDISILRNKDGLAWRDIVPGTANSGAGNVQGLWGNSLAGFGTAWQSNGDGFMRTRPVVCQSMRYPHPTRDSVTDITNNPGVDPNAATEMSVDAWINPSFTGYSGVYHTGPTTAPDTAVPHAWPYDPLNVAADRPMAMQIMSKLGVNGHRVTSFAFGLGGTCVGNPLANDYRLMARISFWDNDQASRWRGVYSNVAIPFDTWSHVAMTFDANDPAAPMRVYLNGKDVTADLSGANDPDSLVNNYCDQPPIGWPISTTRSNHDCESATYTVNGTAVAAGVCQAWWMEESYYRRTPTIGAWNGWTPGNKPEMPHKNNNVQQFPDPWFGKLDDLRLHNKRMTVDELCSRYQNGLVGVPAGMSYENSHTAAACL